MARPGFGSEPGHSRIENPGVPLIDSDLPTGTDPAEGGSVEFLNFVLMFVAAWIVLRRPEKERLAFRLLVTSAVIMVALFCLATRTALLPGVNY